MQPEFLFYKIRNPTYQIDKETQFNFSNPENQLKISFRLNNFSIERKLFPSKTHSPKKVESKNTFWCSFWNSIGNQFLYISFLYLSGFNPHTQFSQKKIENQNWIGSNTTTAAKNCNWTFHLIKTKAHAKPIRSILKLQISQLWVYIIYTFNYNITIIVYVACNHITFLFESVDREAVNGGGEQNFSYIRSMESIFIEVGCMLARMFGLWWVSENEWMNFFKCKVFFCSKKNCWWKNQRKHFSNIKIVRSIWNSKHPTSERLSRQATKQ